MTMVGVTHLLLRLLERSPNIDMITESCSTVDMSTITAANRANINFATQSRLLYLRASQ